MGLLETGGAVETWWIRDLCCVGGGGAQEEIVGGMGIPRAGCGNVAVGFDSSIPGRGIVDGCEGEGLNVYGVPDVVLLGLYIPVCPVLGWYVASVRVRQA